MWLTILMMGFSALLTNTQGSKIRKYFASGSSANTK